MIDDKYLLSGLRIRTESENALSSITIEEKKLQRINDNMTKITKELEVITNNLEKYSGPEEVKDDFFKKLKEIEIESTKLSSTLDPLNVKMEKLAKEEEQLWNTVREKYPTISDDDIIKEFQDYIIKNN